MIFVVSHHFSFKCVFLLLVSFNVDDVNQCTLLLLKLIKMRLISLLRCKISVSMAGFRKVIWCLIIVACYSVFSLPYIFLLNRPYLKMLVTVKNQGFKYVFFIQKTIICIIILVGQVMIGNREGIKMVGQVIIFANAGFKPAEYGPKHTSCNS